MSTWLEQSNSARPTLKAGGCAVCIASMSAYMVPPNEVIDRALADPLADDFSPERADARRTFCWKTRAWPMPTPRRRSRNMWQSAHQPGVKKASASFPFLPGLIDTEMGRLENDAMRKSAAMRSLIALDSFQAPEIRPNWQVFFSCEKLPVHRVWSTKYTHTEQAAARLNPILKSR